jgi:two-component system OmpR family response regulator
VSALDLLYVDDDMDIREIAVMSLELDPQIKARSASSGGEALQVLADGFRPDAILMDVMMPDMDGPQTLERIRAQPDLAHIPLMFVTARVLPEEQARFLSLGAAGVIIKPFDPMGLAQQVRKILAAA